VNSHKIIKQSKSKKMKRKILIIALCSLCFLALEAHAVNPNTALVYNLETDLPPDFDKIELHGDLATSVGPNTIVAGSSDDAVYIAFNQNFGNVNISLYNPTGILIYNGVVDTSMQQLVIIPITSAASGTYTVVLNNANGYAEGNFERN